MTRSTLSPRFLLAPFSHQRAWLNGAKSSRGASVEAAGAVLVVALLLGALAMPAGAHSETGVLGIETSPGTAARTARVRVLLEYSNDRHPVPGASVVAEAVGPGGQTVPSTPLADLGNGVYEATLTMPVAGSWTVNVTATNPSASAQSTVTVSDVSTSSSTTGTSPTTIETSSLTTRGSGSDDDDSGGSGTTDALLIVGIVAVAAAVVTIVVVRLRRR